MNSYDEEYIERFSKRKDRRRPKGKRSVRKLQNQKKSSSHNDKFSDPSLQNLFERGYIDELLSDIKSGKEASVYKARGREGLMAAKIYHDRALGAAKNDVYVQGRYVSSSLLRKVNKHALPHGLSVKHALWILHEYLELWDLYKKGVAVPKPLVGPGIEDILQAGRVVLMELIGDEVSPAPRLAEVELSPSELESAWQQSIEIMSTLLSLGKVHGDFSAYNLLWWEDKAYLIDFPQLVKLKQNKQAHALLKRDVESLCQSFKVHGFQADPVDVLKRVKQMADFEVPRPYRSLRV